MELQRNSTRISVATYLSEHLLESSDLRMRGLIGLSPRWRKHLQSGRYIGQGLILSEWVVDQASHGILNTQSTSKAMAKKIWDGMREPAK